jgi:hypothetical protein
MYVSNDFTGLVRAQYKCKLAYLEPHVLSAVITDIDHLSYRFLRPPLGRHHLRLSSHAEERLGPVERLLRL